MECAVEVRAADGLSLPGLMVAPDDDPSDCVVWVHGFGVSYDLPQTVRLARELAARGITFVAAGLRARDGGATGWRRVDGRVRLVRIGGWWEVFEESALDVAAWIEHAANRAEGRVVLAGHSFGALRALHYLRTGGAGVDALVLGSFSYGLRHLDPAVAETAVRLVEEGRGEELLPLGSWPRGFGTDTVSAQTYASWWRVAPGFFAEPSIELGAVSCPVLAWYGTENDVGGEAELAWLVAQLTGAPAVECALVPGVSHGYPTGEDAIANTIAAWLAADHDPVGTQPNSKRRSS